MRSGTPIHEGEFRADQRDLVALLELLEHGVRDESAGSPRRKRDAVQLLGIAEGGGVESNSVDKVREAEQSGPPVMKGNEEVLRIEHAL